jgi:hypothetical protein
MERSDAADGRVHDRCGFAGDWRAGSTADGRASYGRMGHHGDSRVRVCRMAGKMADLCRLVIVALCGPVPGVVSGRARDVESRTILADYPLLAAAVQEYGRSDTSLGHAFAGITPWGTGRFDRRALAKAPWLLR